MEGLKKPITPTLKKMKVGDKEKWPVEQSTSLSVTYWPCEEGNET
jgi:hypothetical protein